jgi:heme/copper-type cytochrome/quinol oxidase subunit 4
MLAYAKQTDIAVYFTVSVIAYLIITVLFIYLSPRTRKALSVVAIVFLAGFMVVVILKVMEVLNLK